MCTAEQDTEGYEAALDAVHEACASRLLRLCSSNGGVYIKAAQLISTAQSVPVQYRRQGALYMQAGVPAVRFACAHTKYSSTGMLGYRAACASAGWPSHDHIVQQSEFWLIPETLH